MVSLKSWSHVFWWGEYLFHIGESTSASLLCDGWFWFTSFSFEFQDAHVAWSIAITGRKHSGDAIWEVLLIRDKRRDTHVAVNSAAWEHSYEMVGVSRVRKIHRRHILSDNRNCLAIIEIWTHFQVLSVTRNAKMIQKCMALLDCKIVSRWHVEARLERIHVLFENVVWETTGEFDLCCAISQKAIQAQSRKSPSVCFGFIHFAIVHIFCFQTRPCEIKPQQTT